MFEKPRTWECKHCGSTVLMEESSAHVQTRVLGIEGDDLVVSSQVESVLPGQTHHYECAVCGKKIKNGPVVIDNREDLVRWLKRE